MLLIFEPHELFMDPFFLMTLISGLHELFMRPVFLTPLTLHLRAQFNGQHPAQIKIASCIAGDYFYKGPNGAVGLVPSFDPATLAGGCLIPSFCKSL
jgi:hypothetical protein